MRENHKELISVCLTIGILILTLFIIHRFIPSIIWAAIIAIASYPLYLYWRRCFGSWRNSAALLFTCIVTLVLIMPLSWLITVLIQETQVFFNYLQSVNRQGGEPPALLEKIPIVGSYLINYWDDNLGQAGSLKYFLSNLHISLTPASYYIKQVSFDLAHRSIQIGFTFLTLFFFYRDGEKLTDQINYIGDSCLGSRWHRYSEKLPAALRSTVNGTIVVGLGVGVLMGACYALVGFPAPTLTGLITAFAAMIPFMVPIVVCIVALVLFVTGNLIASIIVLIWGTIVVFLADHFIKPVLIGGAIKLPFLLVLFSILGGLETLGFLGLFLGPMIMVLFVTLWNESQTVVPKVV